MATCTLVERSTGLESVTTNVKPVVPAFPSGCVALPPLTVNVAVSSFSIVPTAAVALAVSRGSAAVPSSGLLRLTLNVSSSSTVASPLTLTVTVWLC